MAHVVSAAFTPNRERLAQVLSIARTEPAISLNMATFWATPRHPNVKAAPVGCLLGHYVHIRKPAHLELVPLNFLEQVKAPILASQLFQKYPNRLWQHHTLHYSGPDIEAWGLNAACLYFGIRAFDAQRLFWPAGASYALELSASLVTGMLEKFLRSEEVVNP
jgi:hypothetical protein